METRAHRNFDRLNDGVVENAKTLVVPDLFAVRCGAVRSGSNLLTAVAMSCGWPRCTWAVIGADRAKDHVFCLVSLKSIFRADRLAGISRTDCDLILAGVLAREAGMHDPGAVG